MANVEERRGFLRFAAAAGGAALLSSCSGGGQVSATQTRNTAKVIAASAGPKPSDWAALARDLSGPLVRPGQAAYTAAKRLFDPRFDSIRPAGIAYCRNPHDVATCLAFVRKFGIPVAARCGGHSYAGWSSTSGLIIDVTRMSGVSVRRGTATGGAGTHPIDLYHRLAAHR